MDRATITLEGFVEPDLVIDISEKGMFHILQIKEDLHFLYPNSAIQHHSGSLKVWEESTLEAIGTINNKTCRREQKHK